MNPDQPIPDRDGPDDTEGHRSTPTPGGLAPGRGLGQSLQPTHPRAAEEEDDVSGHLSGALGSKKKTEHGS